MNDALLNGQVDAFQHAAGNEAGREVRLIEAGAKRIAVLSVADIVSGALVKPFIFGFLIAMVGCYMGLTTTGGTQGVGRSTTQSVVVCSVCVLASDFLLTKIFFAIL